MSAENNILRAIGKTSLVQMQRIIPPGYAKVLAKLEWQNPTGNMKDRMAQAMISSAEADGRLKPGDTIEAKAMARRLAREEGLFAGTSSGANVVAAIQVAKRLGPDAKVVTLTVDSGLKYLSTDVFARSA